ncbi:MAG: 30S ribosomal protein S15 [Candidatus Aenigmarchaeota archaeon]|nr:30S ribosomal protein S15 [Candidatus Aenigmarchaeota archaeon]
MARMHSRKHGKHGSKKPVRKKAVWVSYEAEEVEKLVQKLAKEGTTNAMIGLKLRDQYGVPDVRAFNLRVANVAKKVKKEQAVPEDMYSLIKKAVNLHKHMAGNRGDAKAKHGLELLESKIRRLGKYYARKGILQKGWKYSIENAKLIVK